MTTHSNSDTQLTHTLMIKVGENNMLLQPSGETYTQGMWMTSPCQFKHAEEIRKIT